jgi:hypothetical protein
MDDLTIEAVDARSDEAVRLVARLDIYAGNPDSVCFEKAL